MNIYIFAYLLCFIAGSLFVCTGTYINRSYGIYIEGTNVRVGGIALILWSGWEIWRELIKIANKRREISSSKTEIDDILNQQRLDKFDKVFGYIDTLMKFRKYKEAIPYLDAVFTHFPLRFDYQLLYVKCLKKTGKEKKANEVAMFVNLNTEDDCYVEQVADILGWGTADAYPHLDNNFKSTPCVCLIPVSSYSCDSWLILRLKSVLLKLDIDVVARKTKLDRTAMSRESEKTVLQWDAEKIVTRFSEQVKDYDENIIYILITSSDLYVDSKDYVVDYMKGKVAVVSYCRFKATFNDGIPSQQRVLYNTAAVCLSLIIKMFEINISCLDDTCMCSHDFSVDKGHIICPSCLDKLKRAIPT